MEKPPRKPFKRQSVSLHPDLWQAIETYRRTCPGDTPSASEAIRAVLERGFASLAHDATMKTKPRQ